MTDDIRPAPQEAARTALERALRVAIWGHDFADPEVNRTAAELAPELLMALERDPEAARAVVALLGGETAEALQSDLERVKTFADLDRRKLVAAAKAVLDWEEKERWAGPHDALAALIGYYDKAGSLTLGSQSSDGLGRSERAGERQAPGSAAPQDDREAEPELRDKAEELSAALGAGKWSRSGVLAFGGPIDKAHEALDLWLRDHPARSPQAPESPEPLP